MFKLRYFLLIFSFFLSSAVSAQKDSSSLPRVVIDSVKKELKAPVKKDGIDLKQGIIPLALMTYGIVALFHNPLNKFNYNVKEFVYDDNNSHHNKLPIDNFTLAAPAVTVYVLNICGVHGKNNLIDRSAIFGLANLMGNGVGFGVKFISHEVRPDSTDKYSFPSGHTFNAFLGAEFLRQEYKDVSPWIGVAGYVVAAGTGYLRMYNDKHWFNDVVAGAGMGILSTRIAYWIYPTIKHALFHSKKISTIIMPTYENGYAGVSMVHYFSPP